ncbi:MAG: type II restriction endonuclease [Nitrospiraceae bacterium]|nr:type II restriction endonuclease [Nitrospiraceae bacterium]
MPSPACEEAIKKAFDYRKAILKFISPNDVGLTGGHQYGYYLPKKIWRLYTVHGPVKGKNYEHHVEVIWQDGCITQSIVKWYGVGTRSEYRLTRFGRGFPFLTEDCVGNLLILIPERIDRFFACVLDLEDDIEDIQAALGVDVVERWALFDRDAAKPVETEDACMDRHFREFAKALTDFPPTLAFANEARQALIECVKSFMDSPSDNRLTMCTDTEYKLFKLVERKICEPEIVRVFKSVDDFLGTAQTILQRRKARAGRSLEHHVEYLLREAEIPFDIRVDVEGTKPDILIPGKHAYLDPDYPLEKLFMLGIKTTCKDRWRQVTKEAPRISHKHILTIQQGISINQIDEMERYSVKLVVPHGLHTQYPPKRRDKLLTFARFIDSVKVKLAG